MNRRKPLRRSGDLARRELKRDTEKVREFMRRQKALERKPRARPPEGPLTPREWQIAVWYASEGKCILTGARARDADDPRFHAHHPLPKRTLRDRGYHGRVWDPRNGAWLLRDVHMQHEGGALFRVPWTRLPPSVWEFCGELDALEGTKWATGLVLRGHPVRGARGHSQQEEAHEGRSGDGH